MPTIRIDDDVWQWLQCQARPFQDTPNSVLRRVAGIDQPGSNHSQTPPPIEKRSPLSPSPERTAHPRPGERVSGASLNHLYRLNAKHSLYHKDSTFYEQLVRFPGVLCDSRGYVSYESAKQFAADPALSIGQKVNVKGGLNAHPRYRRFPSSGAA